MEKTRGLNCSAELSVSPSGHDETPRRALERTVNANQQLLDRVKERENRANSLAALFRKRHLDLLREVTAEEEEIKQLNARSRHLTVALRNAQHVSASLLPQEGGACGATTSVTAMACDSDVGYKHLQQQLMNTSRVKEALQMEIQRLGAKEKEEIRERDLLMLLVTEQQEVLDPLVQESATVARDLQALQNALHPSRNFSRCAKSLNDAIAWTKEEELALNRITALMGAWNSEEDRRIMQCARVCGADEAVRLYQEWNNALQESIRLYSHECERRRNSLFARVSDLKRDLYSS